MNKIVFALVIMSVITVGIATLTVTVSAVDHLGARFASTMVLVLILSDIVHRLERRFSVR